MDDISVQSLGSAKDDDDLGWRTFKSKRTKRQGKNRVVVASRTSQQVPTDGIPIATKAIHRAIAKDNPTSTLNNPFTILNNASIASLKEVLADLEIEFEQVEVQLDAFRSEELARAAIAEANYKSFLEKQNNRSRPESED